MVDENTIICDIGTNLLKIGFSGEDSPRCVIPTTAGIPNVSHSSQINSTNSSSSSHKKKTYIYGNKVLDSKLVSSRIYPMDNGIVRDWETMDSILKYGFSELLGHTNDIENRDGKEIGRPIQDGEDNFFRAIKDSESKKILLTEPTLSTVDNKKKIIEYMFETFNVGAINITNQALLVLYARGLVSGMVVECGEALTQIVPVFDGMVPHHLIKRHGVCGKTITSYLRKLLQLQGSHNVSKLLASDGEIVRDIKEKLCYASCDLREDRDLARETTALVERYTLPDGTVIKVGQERFEATEAYFDPSLVDVECRGLSDLVFDTIQECDIDCRMSLYEHIVLSGGSSMFPGMPVRLQKDVRKRYMDDILKGDESRMRKFRINVEAPTHRSTSVFSGASILADLMKHHDKFWVTKADYEELGVERALKSLQL